MTSPDLLAAVPARGGHFLLESGYHTDVWLALDGLFVHPAAVAPLVAALADRLRPHSVSAVCGPLMGGAFLAQSLATALGVGFFFTEPVPGAGSSGLFQARYVLSPELRRGIRGQRVAVVDDAISAGSSVRATVAALDDAEATVPVVGTLVLLGETGLDYFAGRGVPVESLGRRPLSMWAPSECPLCRGGRPLEDPRAAGAP